MGWHFEWPPYSYTPFMIKPTGEIVWLIARNYVPYLVDRIEAVPGYVADHIVAARVAAAVGMRRHRGRQPVRPGDEVRSTLQQEVPEAAADGTIPAPPEPDPNAPLIERRRSRARCDVWEESLSIKHTMTHSPPNPYCWHCRFGKGFRVPHRAGAMERNGRTTKKEGDLMLCDYVILKSEVSTGGGGERVLLNMLDAHTDLFTAYPSKQRNGNATYHGVIQH